MCQIVLTEIRDASSCNCKDNAANVVRPNGRAAERLCGCLAHLSCSEAEQAAVRRASWQALEGMVDEGVVGKLGVSNWDVIKLED